MAGADLRRGGEAVAEQRLGDHPRSFRWALAAFGGLFFTWLFLINSWTGDDAFISYRAGWNLLHGYGFTFNPSERVQAFTNPLWTALLAAAAFITGEFFYTAQLLSWACGIAVLVLVVRRSAHWTVASATILVLLSSKAYVDYSSSGLETPLNYLLVAAVTLRTLRAAIQTEADRATYAAISTAIASLAFVNRPDTVLLTLPCVIWQVVVAWPDSTWRARLLVVAGTAPVVCWLAFSLLYYGFPLPNTYYAKVATGLPEWMVIGQGVAYVANSLSYDPVTLFAVAGAAAAACITRVPAALAGASGALLYVLYAAAVGGDFMSGRLFALPFLQSTLTASALAPYPLPLMPVAALLVAYNLVNPLAPVKTRYDYAMGWPWRQQNGIKDERGAYHAATNLLHFDPLRPLPDFIWVREGLSARSSGVRVLEHGSIGMVGYYGGPDLYLIDRNALADPLLARLPVSDRIHFEFYAGHHFRDIPEGYAESRREGTNRLVNPRMRELYDALRVASTGPLLTQERLRAIWRLNVGDLSDVHDEFRPPVSLSVRAGHWRFTTDVGDRDPEQRWLRSQGRAGYLQLGPRVPLERGLYEARWLGTLHRSASSTIGFVEAWADGRLLASREVNGVPGAIEVTLPFVVPARADCVDYRLRVRAGVELTLERVELQGRCAGDCEATAATAPPGRALAPHGSRE